MTTQHIVLVVAVLGALLAAGFLLSLQSSPEAAVSTPRLTPIIKEVAVAPLATDVTVSLDNTDWQAIATTTSVRVGSAVRTSPEGRAVITHEANILTSLSGNTEVTIALAESTGKNAIDVASGAVWSKIHRALEQDEQYEVYTPTLVAAVRGTSFGTKVGEATDSVIVTEGVVTAYLRSSTTGELLPETAVLVRAGEVVERIDGRLATRTSALADFDSWFYENNPEFTPPSVTATDTDTKQPAAPELPLPPRPSLPETTENNTPAPIMEVDKLQITDISPNRFVYGERDQFSVSGEGLERVEQVEVGGDTTDFYITDRGVMIVFADTISNDDEVYDIRFVTDSETVLIKDALTIQQSEKVVVSTLRVDRISYSPNEDQRTGTVTVTGEGFTAVDSVLVDGQSVTFSIISNTQITFTDSSSGDFFEVVVKADNKTASGFYE